MNRLLTTNTPFSNSQLENDETLALIHEGAKLRAHALRREAISGLIDDMIAWLSRKPAASRRAVATQTPCTPCPQ